MTLQKPWHVSLNYHSVTPPGIINKVSFADSNRHSKQILTFL